MRVRLVGVAAALAVGAAACGTSGVPDAAADPDDGVVAGEPAADDGADDLAQRAMEVLESDFYGQGSYAEPASIGPEAQTGARIAIVSSGVQSATGTEQAEAAREVADLLGWDLSIHDGQYDPSAYQEGIRQAVAQNVDVIWLFAVDCPVVQTALEEAKAGRHPSGLAGGRRLQRRESRR